MARPRRGVSSGRGTDIGRGTAQGGGPGILDRVQRFEDQLAQMAAMIPRYMLREASARAVPVPPAAPATASEGLPVSPAPVPPAESATSEAVAAAEVAPGVAGEHDPVHSVALDAARAAYMEEKRRFKGVLLEFNKLKPQEFSGCDKNPGALEEWWNHMEGLFRDQDTEERDKVTLGVCCLGVSVGLWWNNYRRQNYTSEEPKPTWEQFKEALCYRYLTETVRETLERHLETIRQGDRTVREYEELFTKIADLVPRAVQDERRKVRLFIQGLRPEIRRQLLSHLIVKYDDCIEPCIAIEAELAISRAKRAELDKGKGKKRPYAGNGEGSSEPNQRRPRPPGGQNQASGSRGSYQQQRARPCVFCGANHRPATCKLRHGKCYTCGQPGHISANCPRRSAANLPALAVPPLATRPPASTQSVAASSRSPARLTEGSRQVSGGRVYVLTQHGELSGEGPSGA